MRMLFKIISVAVVVIVLLMFIKNQKSPATIGVINGKLSEVPDSPNGVSTQTTVVEKQVLPLPFKSSLEESKQGIKKAVENYGGGEIIKEEAKYIYVVFTTGTMRYKDDAEFYFDTDTQLIHFRSASRVGYSDMGLNKERYETLSNLYLNN